MSEVIEAEAVAIDSEVTPLTGLDVLISDITGEAERLSAEFSPYEIEDGDAFRQAKRERTAARKAITSLNARYSDAIGSVKALVADADARMKAAIAPLSRIDQGYKAEIDAYTGRWERNRIEVLRAAYEDAAPDLALPQEGADREMLPFSVLLERYGKTDPKKWLLMSSNIEAVKDQLLGHLADIANSERSIDRMVCEEDRAEVKAHFFATLDLDAALREADERAQRRERMARLEEERAARAEGTQEERMEVIEEWIDELDEAGILAPEMAPEPVPTPSRAPEPAPMAAPMAAPAPMPAPAPAEPSHPWVMVLPAMTRTQALRLRDLLVSNGYAGGRLYAGTLAQAYAKEMANE